MRPKLMRAVAGENGVIGVVYVDAVKLPE